MLLDLEDMNLKASVRRVSDDRVRLVIEYPFEERYRRVIYGAFADLLQPNRDNAMGDQPAGGKE